MISLRKPETEEKYQEHLKTISIGFCPFCRDLEVKKKYKYWIITPNEFPYDFVYSVSDMLVCRRHVADETELTLAESEELTKIKREILTDNHYNQIVENSKPRRTVPPHYHLHLLSF